MKVIEIRDLCKNYGKTVAVKDLNLDVSEGEIFGFIGPNGAGKSTTIRSMLGLITPTSGEIKLLGQPSSMAKHVLLKDIGYLPGEMNFYDNMKVKEIAKFSADLRKMDCSKEAHSLMERLNLNPDMKISQLSLGNRKKVGILCALQHRPKLCVLDEPTSGLDPLIQREFFDILKERNIEGTTIFLSSHVLGEIQRHCTRAAVIREGKLLACDDVSKLAHTDTKRVTLQGIDSLPETLSATNVEKTSEGITFMYKGKAKELLQVLNQLPVTDVTIQEPQLEEVFMHYYEEG